MRLTTREKYPHGAEGVSEDKLTGGYCRGIFEATACINKLSEYENAEEDGLLVRLPVPIGTKVYGIYTGAGGKNHVVLKVSFDYGMIPLWGKSVFDTEEAAKEHI